MEAGGSELIIREATEDDAAAIIRIFRASYGEAYMYPQFYDEAGVRRMILSDGTLVLVAENRRSSRVLGTASVLLEIGAYSDLVGEFGRLAVLPEARGRGVGNRLMLGRLERVRDRLHVGVVEARTAHPYSGRIAVGHGFAPVGVLPNRLFYGNRREHGALFMQFFGDAVELRKNHPRIIPEAYPLAAEAMANLGLPVDVVVEDREAPYPYDGEFEIEDLEESGYSSLLRIERGRVRHREVFGPLKLHYGFFRLEATHARYLIARDHGRVAGAVGFIHDEHERHVRVFELIAPDDAAVRRLLDTLGRRAADDWGVATIEIDVRAEAPRMQRTLLELGYRPVAYLPAFAFHRVERLDVMKMWRLLEAPTKCACEVPEPAAAVVDSVLETLREERRLPRVREAIERLRICRDLNEEQASRFQRLVVVRRHETGETLFHEGEPSDEMCLVLAGRVSIRAARGALGTVHSGECAGEVAFLAGDAHSATAVVDEPTEVAVLTRDGLESLVRRRPDIGVVVYRNLARELGGKLRRADLTALDEA